MLISKFADSFAARVSAAGEMDSHETLSERERINGAEGAGEVFPMVTVYP